MTNRTNATRPQPKSIDEYRNHRATWTAVTEGDLADLAELVARTTGAAR